MACVRAQRRHLIEVDALVVLADAVVKTLIQLTGEIKVHTVGEMAAVGEVHGQDRIARFQTGEVNGHVGLGAGMRLDVGVFGAEELAGAVDGQPLHNVHVLAAAVIALSRIAFGVFIGEDGTLRGQHGGAGVVLGGDHLQPFLLTAPLGADRLPYFGVGLLDGVHTVLVFSLSRDDRLAATRRGARAKRVPSGRG